MELLIWKPAILPKHRLAFCLFAHGKFLTKDRQPYVIDKLCALCKCDNESFFQHLFFSCHKTNELWRKVRDWLGLKKTMEEGESSTRLCSRLSEVAIVARLKLHKYFSDRSYHIPHMGHEE